MDDAATLLHARARLLSRLAVGALLAMLMTGCGSPSPTVSAAGPVAGEIRIGVTEWTISVPNVVARAGDVTLVVTNAGAARHSLVARGERGEWSIDSLAPGETQRLEILTAAGETIVLGCMIRGHEAHGPRDALLVER